MPFRAHVRGLLSPTYALRDNLTHLHRRSFLQHADFKMVGIRVEVFRIYDIDVAKSQFHCDFEIFLVGAAARHALEHCLLLLRASLATTGLTKRVVVVAICRCGMIQRWQAWLGTTRHALTSTVDGCRLGCRSFGFTMSTPSSTNGPAR